MKEILAMALTLFAASQLYAQSRDYSSLHNMLIKFYQYQRAGLKTGSANNANSGFTNASHNGDNYNGNLLDGGWYDAGDYIKFGMNLGYSVYCLLKGYDVFPGAYAASSGSVPDLLMQVKFATDYLCKAVIDNNTVVLDVGIAEQEHGTWGVVNGSGRSGSQIRLCNGGDIPATYAACLALMSVLYRKYDAAYADQCLAKAKTAFTFAKNKFNANQNYCTPQTKSGAALYDYPTVDGKKNQQTSDRMVAAGVELYRATLGTANADPLYKSWAQRGISEFFSCMGFSFIGPLASFEVWRQGLGSASSLLSNMRFIGDKIKTEGAFNGIFQNTDWGTARDAGTVAFEYGLAYIISSSDDERTKYLQTATAHVDWLAGYSGGRSYICGVGSGPTKIHYRTTNYGAVPGAVVSGPDDQGNWSNDGSPQYCEVARDYNAGIVGAVAFLKAVKDQNALKVTKAFTADPTTQVDLTTKPVSFSATLSKSVAWTISVDGAFGTKAIKGTGTSVSGTWDGSADEGFFLAGEIVKARLTVDGDISALDLQKVTPKSIEIIKAKKAPSKTGDKLIDDFEDSDSLNKIGGRWTSYGTGTGLLGTSFGFSTQEGSMALQLNGNVKTFEPTTYSGFKTTFTADGSPCSIGPAKSVYFDLKASLATNVRVELEQADITDNTYYGIVFPVSAYTNSYRLNVAGFTQADWATTSTPLDLNKITALRFTVYDSTGMVKLYLDNLAVEDLAMTATASPSPHAISAAHRPMYANGMLTYTMPSAVTGDVVLSVFDAAGRTAMKQTFDGRRGEASILLRHLPAGMYTAVYSTGRLVLGEPLRFVITD
ncbi:MAG: glycoside hydrolase family 9 protein [Chitinispirillaceae bacterium]|nr:glycoside hydrolase family 9 protein [Chitinispirillaceae bacterium]